MKAGTALLPDSRNFRKKLKYSGRKKICTAWKFSGNSGKVAVLSFLNILVINVQ
jgi:hypothetical protein